MTFSILTHDENTGVYAAAAATGSLCVGGWVLRGDIESGLVASQGTAPSTFWRDDALRRLHAGASAADAIAAVTEGDAGRAHRQLIALDLRGGTAGFTGGESVAACRHVCAQGLAVAGNMLSRVDVLDAMVDAYRRSPADPADRMIAALRAGERAGSDKRGLLSAALLVLSPEHPPIDLRIDHSDAPIADLEALLAHVRSPPYADWLHDVPVRVDRARGPGATLPKGDTVRALGPSVR